MQDERNTDELNGSNLVNLTATIVAAYVSHNAIASGDLPGLIAETHTALSRVSGRQPAVEREDGKPKVAVKKSIMPDYLIFSIMFLLS